MTLAAALLLAAAAAQAAPVAAPDGRGSGARVDGARISVTITRAAVLKQGAPIADRSRTSPRSQRQSRDGRVTYEFE